MTGIILVKTNQTVLIGIFSHNLPLGNASNIDEKLGDYLR